MARLFRFLLRLATGLILLGVAVLALGYFFASRSLPVYSGTVETAGIRLPEAVRPWVLLGWAGDSVRLVEYLTVGAAADDRDSPS